MLSPYDFGEPNSVQSPGIHNLWLAGGLSATRMLFLSKIVANRCQKPRFIGNELDE